MSSIQVGAHAPHVTLHDSDKQSHSVPEHGHVTVLAFFPAAFTSVCQKELCTLRDQLAEYNALPARVYGISVDSPFALAEFKKQHGIQFPLLSDHKHQAIKTYDVVFPNLGNIGYECARRSVWVIGTHGNVAFRWLSDKPSDEPDYAAVLAATRAALT